MLRSIFLAVAITLFVATLSGCAYHEHDHHRHDYDGFHDRYGRRYRHDYHDRDYVRYRAWEREEF